MMALAAETRPPSPEVGEVTDGLMPGPAGDLPYRRRRARTRWWCTSTAAGWVLGDLDSDDPLCRDLCVRSDAVIVSVNYRHAPEARFPAAAEDAFAALRWTAAHAAELGGIPGQIAVAGWSAGGNIAAVACQLARDAGALAVVAHEVAASFTRPPRQAFRPGRCRRPAAAPGTAAPGGSAG